MTECRIGTRPQRTRDDFAEAGTITRMRIELHRHGGLRVQPRDTEKPARRVSSRAPTAQYPIGLEEELRSLSS